MKFYNREAERLELTKLWAQTDSSGTMAVVTGRRRLGKTMLVTEFAKSLPSFYFFVEKNHKILCSLDLRMKTVAISLLLYLLLL